MVSIRLDTQLKRFLEQFRDPIALDTLDGRVVLTSENPDRKHNLLEATQGLELYVQAGLGEHPEFVCYVQQWRQDSAVPGPLGRSYAQEMQPFPIDRNDFMEQYTRSPEPLRAQRTTLVTIGAERLDEPLDREVMQEAFKSALKYALKQRRT